jgi:hypothetical protein
MVSALLIGVLGAVRPAAAQFGMPGMGMNGADFDMITRRSLNTYAKMLKLDESQKEAASSLLEGSQQESRKLMKSFQDEVQNGEMFRDPKGMQEKMKQFQVKVEGIEKQFFEDVKLLLTPEQNELWPSVERLRRREKLLKFGLMSGAGVDILAVAERTKAMPESEGELKEVLSRYEFEMDRLLQTFESDVQKATDDFMEKGNMMDPAAATGMLKKMADASLKVRDMNFDTYRKAFALMPEAQQGAFRDEYNKRAFPTVYRTQGAWKMIEAALKLDDLDGTQRDSVASLRDSYAKELLVVNQKIAAAQQDEEEKSGGFMGVMIAGFMGGEPPKALEDAKAARAELNKSTEAKVSAILRPEQAAKMPEIKGDPDSPMAIFQEMANEMQAESEEE